MASAYSILHNYDQPVYSPDFNFINTALSYKQQKFDQNVAKLQNAADQFAILKVKRDVDQEYINNRLNEVVRTTNSAMKGMDLSDDNFYTSLAANVGQVLDDNVKTAVLSTRQIQSEDAMMEALQKNDKDGKYSQLNHQYAIAKSDRARYLTSDKLGDGYRGGFNYVEYRDLSKKVLENLPKLAEGLKESFLKFVDEGSFRAMETYDRVDQEKIKEAMGIVFDQKDMAQLNVNSWGQYGGVDDATLKAEYEAYTQPKINAIEEDINTIQLRLKQDIPADEKAEYRRLLEDKQTYLDEVKTNSDFDSLLQANGREAIEQRLYKGQFFETIANTYGYDARFVKRELDEVHAKNVELTEKQRQFDLEYELKVDKANFDKEQAKLKSGGGDVNADGLGAGMSIVAYSDVLTEEEKANKIETFEDQMESSEKDMKALIRERFNGKNLTNKQFAEFSQLLDLTKVQKGQEYTVELSDGTKLKFDPGKDYDRLSKFYKGFVEDTPERREYYDQTRNVVSQVKNDLTKMVKGGNTEVYGHIPTFYFKVVGDEKKGFELQRVNDRGYFSYLLQKEAKGTKLTTAEQKSIEAFTALTLASGDESAGELDSANRKALLAYTRDRALKGVKTNGLLPTLNDVDPGKKFARDVSYTFKSTKTLDLYNKIREVNNKEVMKSTSAQLPKGEVGTLVKKIDEFYDLQSKRRLTQQESVEFKAALQQLRDVSTPKMRESRNDLGDLGVFDTQFKTEKGRKVSFGDYEGRLDTMFSNANQALQDKLDQSMKEKRVGVVSFTTESPSYDGLANFLSSTTDEVSKNFSKPIFIQRHPTDATKVQIGFTAKGGSGISFKDFDKALVEKAVPGARLASSEAAPYDATKGEYARKLNLGSNNLSNSEKQVAKANNQLPFSTYPPETLLQVYNIDPASQIGENYKQLIQDYQTGKIKFQIEPVQGEYRQTMRTTRVSDEDDANLLYIGESLGKEILQEEEREYLRDVIEKNENLFQRYIESQVNTTY